MEVRTVEIEFTEDTYRPDGDVRRNKGDRLLVDKMSAHSFCDVKKVARRVADGPVLSTSKRVPRTKKHDEEPAKEPAEGEHRPG
jgi:hypothetical protein